MSSSWSFRSTGYACRPSGTSCSTSRKPRRPEVQPRFVQAQTAERLRTKLSMPVKSFTTAQPSIARVWDVLLAGKDNFAVDRDQADKLLSVFPRAAELARESRQFQARAVTYVARSRYPAVP